jgi:TRAP-type transport system periplasmic protein
MKKRCAVSAALLSVTFTAMFMLWFCAAASAQIIELKYASLWPPPPHPMSIADTHWIDKIEKESNGKVKIKPYWMASLITPREGPLEVANGVADIAYAPVGYLKAGFELAKAQECFYQGAPDLETRIRIFWEVWNKFPEMKKEFSDFKLVVVGSSGEPSYHLMTNKPVRTLSDLKGMRIKAPPALINTLKQLGAEGIIISMADVYEQMQKGIIQGAFALPGDYKSMKFAEVVKYDVTNITVDVNPAPFRIMAMSSWNKLPLDVQKVIDANKQWWSMEHAKEMQNAAAAGQEAAVKAGIQFVKIPETDVVKFREVFHQETIKANRELDAKGIPATKYYEEIQRLIVEAAKKK